ncbi:hypothetical protein CDEST_09696 [Colletotrichum destructivum]|uniref:Uncharacterized protein n=1 Tax=Colletotrichum destructivum TaxID=34406 RepID=A0AAX4IND1_9PEZI|nr:hypothetical protein CDEST_09696 [Colletotrichum destructivum]
MGPVSVVLSMSNNLTGRQTPSTPEDITRSLQLQLAQSPAAGTGLSATTYRHRRDKRKAQHEDPTWNVKKPTGAEPGPESSQAVKRRGQQDPGFGFASELQQYLDVLRQHEVETIDVLSPAPSTPQEPEEAVTFAPNLPYPVIIPQRRSATTRARGFVCDYSPALRSAGVGEKSFSGFISQLNRVAELKPRAHAVSFGGFADVCAGMRRDPFMSMAVCKAVEMKNSLGKPTVMNKFITNMNDELFKPKGLVCLLITWEVEEPVISLTDRSNGGRRLTSAKNEPKRRVQWPDVSISTTQAMSAIVWPQPANGIERDGNTLSGAETSTMTWNQSYFPSPGGRPIHSQEDQCVMAHHVGEHCRPQVGNIQTEPRFLSAETIPYKQVSSGGDLSSVKPGGQTAFNVSSWRMAFEQQEASEDSTGSFWGFDTFVSFEGAQQVAETQQKPSTEADDPEPRSNSVASPSFTTGAFKVVETDSLCLLITSMPLA